MDQKEAYEFYDKGTQFYDQGKLEDALLYYKKALSYFKSSGGSLKEADFFLKLGDTYSELNQYDRAEEFYLYALDIYSDKKDIIGEGYALTGLGISYEKRGDNDQARAYYNKALKKFEKAGDSERQGIIHSLTASTFEYQGAWEDALMEYKRSSKKFIEVGDHQKGTYIDKITEKLQEKRSTIKRSKREKIGALIYLFALVVAEVLVAHSDMRIGLALEAVILFALLIHSSFKTSDNFSVLLRSMMALPIIRIIGLSIPGMMQIPALYWFPIIAVPLFAASYTIMRSQGLTRKNVGLIFGNIPVQLLIASTGIFLGTIEYFILTPKPLINSLDWQMLIVGTIILTISTGLAEEILFRGILQKNAENVFGKLYGILYSAFLFTALHIGWNSYLDLVFVLLVALFYGYSFEKTKSIFGVTLSHGISNTFLFLIIPFYAPVLLSMLR
jgi:uncharacterized protein